MTIPDPFTSPLSHKQTLYTARSRLTQEGVLAGRSTHRVVHALIRHQRPLLLSLPLLSLRPSQLRRLSLRSHSLLLPLILDAQEGQGGDTNNNQHGKDNRNNNLSHIKVVVGLHANNLALVVHLAQQTVRTRRSRHLSREARQRADVVINGAYRARSRANGRCSHALERGVVPTTKHELEVHSASLHRHRRRLSNRGPFDHGAESFPEIGATVIDEGFALRDHKLGFGLGRRGRAAGVDVAFLDIGLLEGRECSKAVIEGTLVGAIVAGCELIAMRAETFL